MKKKHRFNWGDKVKLIGKDNPYNGESGIFIKYDKHGPETVFKERLYITVESDGEQHYFYNDEVKLISKFGGNIISEYLEFSLIEQKPKTKVIGVWSKKSADRLGVIKWYPKWRQYAFFPDYNTVFNGQCLEDIVSHIKGLRQSKE